MLKHVLYAAVVTVLSGTNLMAAEPAKAPAAPTPAAPAWVTKSNADAQALLGSIAQFAPEFASYVGLPGYDDKSADLNPGIEQRSRAASST